MATWQSETVNSVTQPPSDDDPYEVAYARARSLKAMLVLACGEGGESLRNLNDTLQDDYIAAAEEFADQLIRALDALPEYDRRRRS